MKCCHLRQDGWNWRVLYLAKGVRLRKANVCFHLYVGSKNNQINITKQKQANSQNKLVVTSRE